MLRARWATGTLDGAAAGGFFGAIVGASVGAIIGGVVTAPGMRLAVDGPMASPKPPAKLLLLVRIAPLPGAS